MGTVRRIAIDAMGGDHAPSEIVAGAVLAQQQLGVEVLLVGDPEQITACLQAQKIDGPIPEIVPSEGIIEMHEEPLPALKKKSKASINVAMDLVKQGKADAVISAGHSGAAMAAALLRLGRIPGIDRPAIGAVLPTLVKDKRVLILDVGANVDCKPKYLEQFAVMGSIYSECALDVNSPRIGLLNIGEEPTKGDDLALKTHQILQENQTINFVGNAEGRDVLSGQFDVIVCDGFVGNVLLKFAEAIGNVVLQILKEEFTSNSDGVDLSLLKPKFMQIKQRIDHVEHGGGLLLGVNGVCIISHGSSKADSICSAIRLAKGAVDHQVLQRLHAKYHETSQAIS